MRKLIIALMLFAWVATMQAQTIQLDTAGVYVSKIDKITNDGKIFRNKISEKFFGEFEKDPVLFLKTNFDIHEFIASVKNAGYDNYVVTFTSKNGFLKANYNKKGKMLRNFQKFHNTVLPLAERRKLYIENKGWTMVKNKFVARSVNGILKKAVYNIKLERGNEKRSVKMNAISRKSTGVASN